MRKKWIWDEEIKRDKKDDYKVVMCIGFGAAYHICV
jgi:hypothetical protein